MQHPDPDDLALIALGESIDDAVDAHVAGCAQCSAEVESFRMTVGLADLSNFGEDAARPGEHVWQAIAAELGFSCCRAFRVLPLPPLSANPAIRQVRSPSVELRPAAGSGHALSPTVPCSTVALSRPDRSIPPFHGQLPRSTGSGTSSDRALGPVPSLITARQNAPPRSIRAPSPRQGCGRFPGPAPRLRRPTTALCTGPALAALGHAAGRRRHRRRHRCRRCRHLAEPRRRSDGRGNRAAHPGPRRPTVRRPAQLGQAEIVAAGSGQQVRVQAADLPRDQQRLRGLVVRQRRQDGVARHPE